MIAENRVYISKYFPYILNQLNSYQLNNSTGIRLVETKSGDNTIEVLNDGRAQLLHSKYDPLKEAVRFIDQFANEVNNYEHVLFYGIGLGYHIEEFMKRYPEFTFSMYEPKPEIFQLYLKEKNINLPVHRLNNIFIETSKEEGKNFLERLTQNIQERILLIVLPSYQQIFKEEFNQFTEHFKEAVSAKRTAYHVDHLFSARWTLNSLINLPKNILTPNILDGRYKEKFKNKPAIIVSAGPSLEEDYEQLRYIKEHKLAYIFAVGSANRALIAQNILPDAVCTYDPQGHNHRVFASMYENGIDTVPMIYGTSVGFETLNWYQGPKLHMVTSQDTVLPYFSKGVDGSPIDFVYDSPTIAAVTFQLVAKLGCSPILFAGQNLAFKNNLFYAKDVEYKQKNRKVEVEEKDRQKVLQIDDVYGNKVETTPSFNNMRLNIEWYISQFPKVEVYNTTKGGAAIRGASFKRIEDLIKEKLTEPVVEDNWHVEDGNYYDKDYTLERLLRMERSIDTFRKQYWEIQRLLGDIGESIQAKKDTKLTKLIVKFDKLMKKLVNNEAYLTFIQPVNRSQYQALSIRAANIRKQTDEIEKAKLLIEGFGAYLERCKLTLEQIIASISKVHIEVNHLLSPYKFYPSDCGVVHYNGAWQKVNQNENRPFKYTVKQMIGQKNSTLSFKFTGTTLRLLGTKTREGSNHIQIRIDGHTEKFSVKGMEGQNLETANIRQVLYERKLQDIGEHLVEIEIINEGVFTFTGIEINKESRAYHIYEVINMKDLDIGKRIRCHYKATFNNFGSFSGLGNETKELLSPEPSAIPNGDFYFIMVDEIDGEKKLIADRTVQNYISYNTLKSSLLTNKKKVKVNNNCYITLPSMGRFRGDKDNDWYKYIESKNYPNEDIYWNFINLTINFGCDVPIDCPEKGVFRGMYHNGKGTFFGENAHDWFMITGVDGAYSTYGFRPMLIGENKL